MFTESRVALCCYCGLSWSAEIGTWANDSSPSCKNAWLSPTQVHLSHLWPWDLATDSEMSVSETWVSEPGHAWLLCHAASVSCDRPHAFAFCLYKWNGCWRNETLTAAHHWPTRTLQECKMTTQRTSLQQHLPFFGVWRDSTQVIVAHEFPRIKLPQAHTRTCAWIE